jgi:hypothetical protein
MGRAYGSIYLADGATLQAVSGTPAKMTGFATEGPASDDVSGDLSVVPDVANDKITVKGGKAYKVSFNVSGTNSAAGDVQANLRVASVEVAQGQCRANFATGNVDNSMGFTAIIEPSADSAVEIYLEGDATNFTPVFASLVVEEIE